MGLIEAELQPPESGLEERGKDRRDYEREQEPGEECMTFPEPELARELKGVGADRVKELRGRDGHGLAAEEVRAQPEQREEKDELQGVDEVVGELGCDEVEAQGEGDDEAGDGGGSDYRIDADDDTKG